MRRPFTCAPTGMPEGELRGVTVPVASTVRTTSLRTIGAVLNDGTFLFAARGSFSPHPQTHVSSAPAAHESANPFFVIFIFS